MASIGFAAPLTGPQAIVGLPMCRAAALAVERHNAERPASRQVGFVPVDDGADAPGARAAARRLIDAPEVVGLVGHKNSEPCEAAGSLYASAGLAQIAPSATNSALSAHGWPTFFRVCADNARQAGIACQSVQALGVRHVSVVHDTTAYGWPLAEAAIAQLGARGVTVTTVAALPVGTEDSEVIAMVAEALLAGQVELIYAGLTEVEGSLLIRELRRRGSTVTYLGAEGGRSSAFLQLAGPDANGSLHTYAGVDPDACSSSAEFVHLYNERYGESPGGFAAECYDAAGILLRAIDESEAPTREAVLRALREMAPYHGATGTIEFDARGERRDAAVSLWQARDGRMESVTLEDLAVWGNRWSA